MRGVRGRGRCIGSAELNITCVKVALKVATFCLLHNEIAAEVVVWWRGGALHTQKPHAFKIMAHKRRGALSAR